MSIKFLVSRAALIVAFGTLPLLMVKHNEIRAESVRRHLGLSKAEPAVNDSVAASPAVLKLWFTESVQAAGVSVRLTGPGDRVVTLGAVTVDTIAKSPAVAKVSETLAPGKYTVAWKALAADGHPSTGTFAFSVRAPAGH